MVFLRQGDLACRRIDDESGPLGGGLSDFDGRHWARLLVTTIALLCGTLPFVQSAEALSSVTAERPPAEVWVDPDAGVHISPMILPYSIYASSESKAEFLRLPDDAALTKGPKSSAEMRAAALERYRTALARVKAMYQVDSEVVVVDGIHTDVFTPAGSAGRKDTSRVLIQVGGDETDSLQASPVASLGKFKIVAVDVREGPEVRFPTASKEVAAVYRALLRTNNAQNIGIYGCSRFGLIAAEAVAWIAKEKLPPPGAVGLFCGGALPWWTGGDSVTIGYPLMGFPVTSLQPDADNYFAGVDVNDPMVAPARFPAVLAKFPPTLIITSTRDHLLSPAVYTHTQLVKLGVKSELHVWEGMVHGFFTIYPELPETREALNVIVKFFDKHLGRH